MSKESYIAMAMADPGRALQRFLQLVLYPFLRVTLVAPLASGARFVREAVFIALRLSKKLKWFIVEGRSETYVVNCADTVISRDLYATGEFDFDKFETAMRLLARERGGALPEIMFDVGANVGSICIPAVARGHFRRAVAIEPNAMSCRLLRANIALNGLHAAIDVHETAVGEHVDEALALDTSSANFGDHSIARGNGAAGVSIRSTTLDAIAGGLEPGRVFLWMDIQGYEGYALAGAKRLIGEGLPMVIEFWPRALHASGAHPKLIEALREYPAFYDLRNPDARRPIAELAELEAELARDRVMFTDILLLR
ncbi:MAG TPA: FkbM family methyltransferase [Rudaea sp.]|nr:FkbM family methyltransferase [Rudaea sp.]